MSILFSKGRSVAGSRAFWQQNSFYFIRSPWRIFAENQKTRHWSSHKYRRILRNNYLTERLFLLFVWTDYTYSWDNGTLSSQSWVRFFTHIWSNSETWLYDPLNYSPTTVICILNETRWECFHPIPDRQTVFPYGWHMPRKWHLLSAEGGMPCELRSPVLMFIRPLKLHETRCFILDEQNQTFFSCFSNKLT